MEWAEKVVGRGTRTASGGSEAPRTPSPKAIGRWVAKGNSDKALRLRVADGTRASEHDELSCDSSEADNDSAEEAAEIPEPHVAAATRQPKAKPMFVISPRDHLSEADESAQVDASQGERTTKRFRIRKA
eukprot:996082-Rhodomonas_salina.1